MPRSFVFVLAFLAASLGFNVYLAREVRSLRPTPQHDLMLGKSAVSFVGEDLSGTSKKVEFTNGRPTLLYFIDPDCRWCKANAAAFQALKRSMPSDVRVIALTLRTEHIDQFLAETALSREDVLVVTSEKTARDLNLVGTPQTFFIDGKGQITSHWTGSYDHSNKTDIEKRFNLSLPLVPEPA